MTEPVAASRKPSGRWQLAVIAAVFFGPLLFAGWLYYKGELIQPQGRTNHGALLEPIVNLVDEVPESPLHAVRERNWVLLYSNANECDSGCEQALYTVRQSRLMLGREMERLTRVFLHGDSAPDTVFLDSEHTGLVTIQDEVLAAFLDNKKPGELREGGYYLVDPRGNLVMYFEPGLEPGDMVEDIKRLLKLSRIG